MLTMKVRPSDIDNTLILIQPYLGVRSLGLGSSFRRHGLSIRSFSIKGAFMTGLLFDNKHAAYRGESRLQNSLCRLKIFV